MADFRRPRAEMPIRFNKTGFRARQSLRKKWTSQNGQKIWLKNFGSKTLTPNFMSKFNGSSDLADF
jgi:hypothetical protein